LGAFSTSHRERGKTNTLGGDDNEVSHPTYNNNLIIAALASCMTSDVVDSTLRRRTLHHSSLANQPPTFSPHKQHMAYSRRNIATPLSRGGSSNNAISNGKSKTSYRNTILAILVVTSFYTAFLYQRGVFCCVCFG
jgi:hypothetical protein